MVKKADWDGTNTEHPKGIYLLGNKISLEQKLEFFSHARRKCQNSNYSSLLLVCIIQFQIKGGGFIDRFIENCW